MSAPAGPTAGPKGERPHIPELVEQGEGRWHSAEHLFYEGLVSNPSKGLYRVDGGEIAAHAIEAAERTHPGRRVLAVRTVFTREGRHDLPTDYRVETLQAGRSFAYVTVRATQPERGAIADSQVTLVGDLAGPSHQDLVVPEVDWAQTRPTQVDIADPPVGLVGEATLGDPGAAAPVQRAVLPMPATLGDERARAMYVAWMTTHFLVAPALAPHAGIGFGTKATWYTAVLVHDLHLWRPLGAGDDLRFDVHSPVMADSAGLVTSHAFDPTGTLAVSCTLDVIARAVS